MPTCSARVQEVAAELAAPRLPASETQATPAAALPTNVGEQGEARRKSGSAKQREPVSAGSAEAAQPAAAGRKGGAGKRIPGALKQKRLAPAGGAAATPPAAGGTGASAPARVPGPRKQGKRAAGRAAEEPVRAGEAEPALPARAARSGGERRQQAGKAAKTQRARVLAQAKDRASGGGVSGRRGGPSMVEEESQDMEGDSARAQRTRDQGGARQGPADEGADGSDEEASACSLSHLLCILLFLIVRDDRPKHGLLSIHR